MKKLIVTLNGDKDGKNIFMNLSQQKTKITNKNIYDILTDCALSVGWNGIKSSVFYEYLSGLKNLADIKFNFTENFYSSCISKFIGNINSYMLIFHGCNKQDVDNLKEKYPNVISIRIMPDKDSPIPEGYDYILFAMDENFIPKCSELINNLLGE